MSESEYEARRRAEHQLDAQIRVASGHFAPAAPEPPANATPEQLRTWAAGVAGLDPELARRLVGETAEQLLDDARTLAGDVGPAGPPPADFGSGARGGQSAINAPPASPMALAAAAYRLRNREIELEAARIQREAARTGGTA